MSASQLGRRTPKGYNQREYDRPEIQKQLLKTTLTPEKAFELAGASS